MAFIEWLQTKQYSLFTRPYMPPAVISLYMKCEREVEVWLHQQGSSELLLEQNEMLHVICILTHTVDVQIWLQ